MSPATRRPSPEIRAVLESLDQAFDRKAWHGTNLRGALRGLAALEAAWRPAAGAHNAWELVLHAAYWKYAVRRRLTGAPRGGFARPGSNFWRRPDGDATAAAWRSDVRLLVAEHRALRALVANLRPEDLDRRPGEGGTTVRAMLAGVALHDAYHAGQIQLLKRLRRKR